MITLPESLATQLANALVDALVEWTALALGVAMTGLLLLRLRRFQRWPRHGLSGLALLVIMANAGIAVAAAAARSEAVGAWSTWLAPRAGARMSGPVAAPAVLAVQPVTETGGGIAPVIGGAGLLLASMLGLSKVWEGVRHRRQMPVVSAPEAYAAPAVVAAADVCPYCAQEAAGLTPSAGRRRARGLTITRL